MLQIRSDASAAAAELNLSAPAHYGHVNCESNCEEHQSCKSDSMDIELDQQYDDDDDVELDL
jgi:hypothetical protein